MVSSLFAVQFAECGGVWMTIRKPTSCLLYSTARALHPNVRALMNAPRFCWNITADGSHLFELTERVPALGYNASRFCKGSAYEIDEGED